MKKLDQWKEEERLRNELAQQVFKTRASQTSQLMVTSFRFKNQTVATIVNFMLSQGERPTNVSQVLRYALEGFTSVVLDKYPEMEVHSEDQALQVLSQAGINTANSKSNRQRQFNNLAIESFMNDQAVQAESTQAETKARYVDGVSVDQAIKLFNEKTNSRPQVFVPENCGELVNQQQQLDDGLPEGFPRPKPAENKPVNRSVKVLKKDGICKEILKDRSKNLRKQVLIVCLECKKPSWVLLDFKPETNLVQSDSCPNCEGITQHQIADNPAEGLEPMNVPLEVFRQQMLNPQKD